MAFSLGPTSSTDTTRRPYSPSQTSSDQAAYSDDDDDDSYLPFPAPLPRGDFLRPDFDPSTYLSSLGPRPQTLEDLRGDLRQRSQLLSQELLELVNARYEDFLGLGGSVAGGGERVEELRVGLMGLRREVDGVRQVVQAQEREVAALVAARKAVVREREWGRGAVRFCEGVARLERVVGIEGGVDAGKKVGGAQSDESAQDEEEDEDDDEEDEDEEGEGLVAVGAVPLGKLRRRVEELLALERLALQLGSRHPVISGQQHRLMKIRNTLLLDLGTVLKRAKEFDGDAVGGTLQVLELYRRMGAGKDAIDVFKRLPRR